MKPVGIQDELVWGQKWNLEKRLVDAWNQQKLIHQSKWHCYLMLLVTCFSSPNSTPYLFWKLITARESSQNGCLTEIYRYFEIHFEIFLRAKKMWTWSDIKDRICYFPTMAWIWPRIFLNILNPQNNRIWVTKWSQNQVDSRPIFKLSLFRGPHIVTSLPIPVYTAIQDCGYSLVPPPPTSTRLNPFLFQFQICPCRNLETCASSHNDPVCWRNWGQYDCRVAG